MSLAPHVRSPAGASYWLLHWHTLPNTFLNMNTLHILVAEDNPINQKLILRQLEKLGFMAQLVGTGEEALTVIQQTHFDLVLMDCQMPGIDGYQAATAIREMGKDIPIIALTASALQGERERCLESGMSDYLSKPYTQQALKETLNRWLRQGDGVDAPAG